MKKILISFVLFFLLFGKIFAHPLDISNSFYSFQGNTLQVTTFFHTYEIEYLLRWNGKNVKNIPEYFQYRETIQDYIHKNISLETEWKNCKIWEIELVEKDEYSIILDGFEVNFLIECPQNIQTGLLQVKYFNEFPLQTNQSTFYDLNTDTTPFHYTVLTPKVFSYQFDLNNKTPLCIVDSDWDGLSDDEERIYGTDAENIDTDGDFFTDYEEVFWWWDPKSSSPWPAQPYREQIPEEIIFGTEKKVQTQADCLKEAENFISQNQNKWLLQEWLANNYFRGVVEKIANYLSWEWWYGIVAIMIFVMFLWFIHAAGPGHSKTLLVSYIIDKNKSFFDGFVFITIFTITHLIDIVVLFILVKILMAHYDISSFMIYIQRVSVFLLSIFSIYLFVKAYKNKTTCKVDSGPKKDFKSNVFLGIISWLVPCTFGWSIFLLLFSLWKVSLILPLILSLGIGIFLFLFLVLTLTYFLRKKYFDSIEWFSKYSSLISAGMLFFISLYLATLLY